MSRDIQLTTLDNGVRVVTDYAPTVDSVAVGIWADVGSRHEMAEQNGISHMLEHMLFKGTKQRSAQQIVDDIENVGGHMNAYTSRDITSYHIHLLKEDMPLAIDVLSDMYLNSTIPDDELLKERKVILQEIGMCNDTPDDLIFDHFFGTAYQNQAAGRSILGPSSIVANMPRESLIQHIENFYTPENTVICAAGNVTHDALVDEVKKRFSGMRPNAKKSYEAANYTGGTKMDNKAELEQVHLAIGFKGMSRLDDRFYTSRLLSSILGGGMSSRLFQEIRENRGLVYSVFSFAQAMQDSGQFGIYAGTGPDQVQELIPAVCEELKKVQSHITETEINRAKVQIKASLLMGQESMMTRANVVAKRLIHYKNLYNPADVLEKIESITAKDLTTLADEIFTSTPTFVAVGPTGTTPSYESLNTLL